MNARSEFVVRNSFREKVQFAWVECVPLQECSSENVDALLSKVV